MVYRKFGIIVAIKYSQYYETSEENSWKVHIVFNWAATWNSSVDGRPVNFSEQRASLSVDSIFHRRFRSHLRVLRHTIRAKIITDFIVYRLFNNPLISS
jgi:hypothetical protein